MKGESSNPKEKSIGVHSKKEIYVLLLYSILLAWNQDSWNRTLDLSLVQGGKVEYPEASPMNSYYNTWNLPAQIFSMMIRANIPEGTVIFVSLVSVAFLSLLSFFFPILYVTRSPLIALIGSGVLNSVTSIYFGNEVDRAMHFFFAGTYPFLTWKTTLTTGHYGILLCLIVIGTLLTNKWRVSGFVAVVTLSVHPLFGFVALIFWASTLLLSKIRISWSSIQSFLLGTLLIGVSYIVHLLFNNEIKEVGESNVELLKVYYEVWDYHRSPTLEIKPSIFVGLLLFLLVVQRLLKQSDNKVEVSSRTLLVLSWLSVVTGILYLLHLYLGLSGSISYLRAAQVGRLTLVPGYLFMPLALGLTVNLVKTVIKSVVGRKQKFQFKSTLQIQNVKKISLKLPFFLTYLMVIILIFRGIDYKSDPIICPIYSEGLALTTSSTTDLVLRTCKKPIMLDVNILDVVAYSPNLISNVVNIIEGAYGVPLKTLPKEYRHTGAVVDESYKEVWEKRTESQWISISSKFNIAVVVVPKTWKLSINNQFSSNELVWYFLSR